jgi:predicted site-specific integrase-resolvase
MDNLYTISQFAKKVNVSASTLRRWDKTGVVRQKNIIQDIVTTMSRT